MIDFWCCCARAQEQQVAPVIVEELPTPTMRHELILTEIKRAQRRLTSATPHKL
jgi:hypothetical protein